MQGQPRPCSVARQLGFPVTLKISSAAIAHKTEAGGVALNLKTAEEVEAAARSAWRSSRPTSWWSAW